MSDGAEIAGVEFPVETVKPRLRRLAGAVKKARKRPGAKAVHSLRISIRRLSGVLKAFPDSFPCRGARKLRRRLKRIMRAAATVRDLDVTLSLAEEAGVAARSDLVRELRRERRRSARRLQKKLNRKAIRKLRRRGRRELAL